MIPLTFEAMFIDAWAISRDFARFSSAFKSKSPSFSGIFMHLQKPSRLYDLNALESGVREIRAIMGDSRHIFNLGHGILPDIPRENVKKLVEFVRA